MELSTDISENIALVVHVEGDGQNLNSTTGIAKGRRYAHEAVRLFGSWRENCGWLKDIHIVAFCSTKNGVGEWAEDEFRKLGVDYIHDYRSETDGFSSGFLMIPFTGWYFENVKRLDENIIVKVDLDNVVLKEFPVEWFRGLDRTTRVGQYSDYIKDGRHLFKTEPFDTSLIISDRDSGFYTKYYELCFSSALLNSEEWKRTKEATGEYWLEEFVVDWMYDKRLMDITPVKDYQYGPGYRNIEWFVKNRRLDNLVMFHHHIGNFEVEDGD